MPASYYINTSGADVERHLMVIHRFLTRQLEVEEAADALVPVVDWQSFPAQSYSQVSICTWDRLGLFSKICGVAGFGGVEHPPRQRLHPRRPRGPRCLRCLRQGPRRGHGPARNPNGRRDAGTDVEQSREHRVAEVLKRLRSIRGETPRIREVHIPTVIDFDNEISKGRTILEIQTEDRLGLLFTITHTLSELGLDISFAKISTEKGAAIDTFYVQDQLGKKITDEARLDSIRAKLEIAIRLLAS